MIREPSTLTSGRKPWLRFLADLPPFPGRVMAGVAWLDRQCPGWHRKINQPIDVGSLEFGPLEQVLGPFHANQDRPLGIRDEMRMGFAIPAENTSNVVYFAAAKELSAEWAKVVTGRLQSGVFPSFKTKMRNP